MAQYDAAVHHDDHGHKQTFLERWFFSTNHKDIGTLYLIFSLVMFLIGGSMAMVIRAELCGKDHGFMPIVVKVVPKAEYQAWLAQQKTAAKALAAN